MQKSFRVTGMTCAACSARVEKAARSVDGVEECAVNLLTGSMSISGGAKEEDIVSAVERAGYGCSVASGDNDDTSHKKVSEDNHDNHFDKESRVLFTKLLSSVLFLLVLMYFSMGHNMLGLPLPAFFLNNPVAVGLVQMLCAVAVMIIGGKFFVSGVKSVIRLSPNMDALVSLGSGAAFIYSTAVLFIMSGHMARGDIEAANHLLHDLYFESAAMILALVTVGKALEARSKAKTGDALRGLKALAPETAVVIRDGEEKTVKISELVPGDIFAVRPGEQIPTDGVITEGSTAINEACVTGESVPAEKGVGDKVIGATINTSGFIKCRAVSVGKDTVLSKIIETVSDANATKAPIAKVADKVAAVFVPAVMLIALITAIVWLIVGQSFGYALARAVSVLVISCPCSLGLATPVAIMVGSGVGAKNGILFKSAAMLELCARVDTVVLDKTGTVTSGDISVTGVFPQKGISAEALLCAAFALEEKSEHPLARAVASFCREKGIEKKECENFRADTGSGVRCSIDGKEYFGGKLAYLSEKGIEIPENAREKADELSKNGNTPLFFACDGKYLGIISAADTVKPDSRYANKLLCRMGIKTVLLSGDNALVTRAIADIAGIEEAYSGASPSDKGEKITELRKSGTVAMIGDGINDAPALALADVGIAIGSGTDVARDTAGVILMGRSLVSAANGIKLSRAVLRNIKQNLFWAFFYNCIGIPVAAGVLAPIGITLSPMIGALAMGLSSVCVVSNALRLNSFKAERAEASDMYDEERLGTDVIIEEMTENTENEKKESEEKTMEKVFEVKGMMCHHCENHVKKALLAIDGVIDAVASHTEGKVVVKLLGDVDDSILKAAITEEGYEVV